MHLTLTGADKSFQLWLIVGRSNEWKRTCITSFSGLASSLLFRPRKG